jgi:cell division septation protein DedD
MNETTHHDALNDEGFHEIQLSGKQLVFLFMAATVVLVFTFLCGVQIGRNLKGDRVSASDASDTVASAATAPPPASTPTEAAPSSGPPAAEPPAPAQDDELSYAKRLQQADSATSEKIPAQPAAAAEPKGPAPKSADPKPAAPATGSAAAAAPVGRPGEWIVQLSANKDRSVAANTARDLAAKGYPAFVLDPAPGAPVIYRVQVGGYPDRDKADQAARRLEKEEHFKPYVRAR